MLEQILNLLKLSMYLSPTECSWPETSMMFPHLPLRDTAELPPLLPPPLPLFPPPLLFSGTTTLQWKLVATIFRRGILNLVRRPLRDRASLVVHRMSSKEAIILYNSLFFMFQFLCQHWAVKKLNFCVAIIMLLFLLLWSVCRVKSYIIIAIHVLYIYTVMLMLYIYIYIYCCITDIYLSIIIYPLCEIMNCL